MGCKVGAERFRTHKHTHTHTYGVATRVSTHPTPITKHILHTRAWCLQTTLVGCRTSDDCNCRRGRASGHLIPPMRWEKTTSQPWDDLLAGIVDRVHSTWHCLQVGFPELSDRPSYRVLLLLLTCACVCPERRRKGGGGPWGSRFWMLVRNTHLRQGMYSGRMLLHLRP